MIKVYALSTCPWCKKLKKLLDEKGINYDCVDVDKVSEQEQEQALAEIDELVDKRKFPITVIDDTVIKGYQPEEIEGALDAK